MSEASARVGVWNRRFLGGFWALFGAACVVLTLSDWFRQARLLPYSMGVGLSFLVAAIGFYRGCNWGRVAIGVMVAPLSLLWFDRLMTLHFERYYGPHFWVSFVLLAVGFYTWVFLFTGLDRDALRMRYREEEEQE